MILLEHPNRSGLWRFEISDYRGRTLFNVRRWYWTLEGELRATKDGVAVPVERLLELQRGIAAYYDGTPDAA